MNCISKTAFKGLSLVLLAGAALWASAPTRAVPLPSSLFPCPVPSLFPLPSDLVLVVERGVESTGQAGAAHDFGIIDALDSAQLEQTFHLRNDGQTPLRINYIQPSCGCASAVLSTEGGADPNTIAPGAQVAVRVTIDVARLHPGHVDKYAMIYVKGDARPAFTLEMRGELPPLVAYRPRVLDFGRVDAGAGNEQTLTVIMDRRLLVGHLPPRLVCTNPDVEIKPRPGAAETTGAEQSRQTIVRTYVISLSRKARLGAVSGAVAFVPADSRAVPPIRTPFGQTVPISDALGGESVILSGEIIGRFYGRPSMLVFGSAARGEEVTRQVKLIGIAPGILDGLTVSCSIPTVTARLAPSQPSAPHNAVGPAQPTVTLEIKLGNNTPAGGLSGEVTIMALDGERLVIPIIGDVTKRTAR